MLAGISNNHECEAREIHFPNFIHHRGGGCKLYKDQLECFLTSRLVPYQFLGHYHVKQAYRHHVIQDRLILIVIDTRSHMIVTVFVLNSCLKRL